MDYIVKAVFKQVLPQFLELDNKDLQMEAGTLKLNKGQLKKDKISDILSAYGATLINSQYEDISLEIPWLSLTSKPTKFSMSRLFLEIGYSGIKKDNNTNNSQQRGYIQSVVQKVVMQVESGIEELEILVHLPDSTLRLKMSNMIVKNSSPYLQEQSVRKTVFIDKLEVELSNCFVFETSDISICVNLEETSTKFIVIVDKLVLKIMEGLLRIQHKMPVSSSNSQKSTKSQHVFFQIRQIVLQYAQLSIDIEGVEVENTVSDISLTSFKMNTLFFRHHEERVLTVVKTDNKHDFYRFIEYEGLRHMIRIRKQNGTTIQVMNVQIVVDLPGLIQAISKMRELLKRMSAGSEQQQQETNVIVYHNRYTVRSGDTDISILLSLDLQQTLTKIMQFEVRTAEHKIVDVSGMKVHQKSAQRLVHIQYVCINVPMGLRKMMLEIQEVWSQVPVESAEVSAQPTIYIIIDYMEFSVGNLADHFIRIVRCQMQDINVKVVDRVQKMALRLTVFMVNQYTLVEQPLTNLIEVAAKTQNNGQIMIDIGNVKSKLTIQQIMQLTRMGYINIVNYCQNDIIVVQEQYRVAVAAGNKQCIWFVRNSLRIHYKGLISQEVQCDFQDGVDKVANFGKFILILKLVRGDIVIKSTNYVMNCIEPMRIVNGKKSMELPTIKYEKVSNEAILWKMSDFDRFARYFSDTHLENLRMHWLGREHVLELMMQKQQMFYYVIRDIDMKQHCGYVWTHNVYSVDTYTIMPFLVVENNTTADLNITIVEKKTGQKYRRMVRSGQNHVPECHGLFDYYLKQFVVQVQTGRFQSEQYYFSTLGYVDEPIERVIPLRNMEMGHYDKMYMCIKETVKVRTRFLSFSSSLKIVNNSQHGFDLQFQQRNQKTEAIKISRNTESLVCLWIKDGDSLTIWLTQSAEAKICLNLTGIVNVKHLLSFNFCKLKDFYRNVLVSFELTMDESGHETIVVQDFVTLCNLCNYNITIDGEIIKPDETRCLDLAPSLNNQLNNKAHRLDQINAHHVYNLLFSEDDSCLVGLEGCDDKIKFNTFVDKTIFESMHQRNKKVYRLLKQIRKKLSFYMIEDICCPNNRYSIISNDTGQHFLISQEVRLQSIFEGVPIEPCLKSVIQPHSVNVIVKKADQNMFFCNQRGQKLSQMKSALLDKAGIEAQKNTFGNVTLIEYTKKEAMQNYSIRLKGLELSVANGAEDVIRLQLVNLNLRKLERNKYDILVGSMSISEVQTKRPILSFPQECYVICEFRLLSNIIVIKNMFAKLKSMVLDMRKDTLLNVIKLLRKVGVANKMTEDTTREQALFELVKSPVVLVKNLFIDQFDINLSISMEAIELQNRLPMLTFKLNNEVFRKAKIINELYKFYSSSVISKFPKLSFIFQNIKHPLSSLKSIFNFRDILAEKHLERVNCKVSKVAIPSVDFLSINKKGLMKSNERVVACLNGTTKIIFTEWNMIISKEEQWTLIDLKKIESVREQQKRGETYVELLIRDKSEIIEVCMGSRKRAALMSLISRLIL